MIIIKDQWTAILANFVRTLVMSQITLRNFITCVLTDRRRKNLQVLSYIHKAHAQVNNIK